MTWVKICGTTNLEDALLAVDAGADAVGFVLAPSSRRVSASQVSDITRELPSDVEKTGVFLNESPEQIIEAVDQAGLTGVQLHGDESPDVARKIASAVTVRIFKGIHAGPGLRDDLATWSAEKSVSALLLDSGNGRHGGGTGKTFDWDEVANALDKLNAPPRIIIAGGLTPSNVRDAVRKFRPWGVDVVSGVESVPGKKDPQKVREFISAVRAAQ